MFLTLIGVAFSIYFSWKVIELSQQFLNWGREKFTIQEETALDLEVEDSAMFFNLETYVSNLERFNATNLEDTGNYIVYHYQRSNIKSPDEMYVSAQTLRQKDVYAHDMVEMHDIPSISQSDLCQDPCAEYRMQTPEKFEKSNDILEWIGQRSAKLTALAILVDSKFKILEEGDPGNFL
jgi:hypothetical protein